MDSWRCGVCGNRIYSAAAIWTCYARTHPSNFVSALPAVPTVVQRTFARFGRVSSSCAHGAGRGGGAVVPWHGGTDCTCLRPRRSQREAAAARCHSCVHSVWDRKKGRCRPRDLGANGDGAPPQAHIHLNLEVYRPGSPLTKFGGFVTVCNRRFQP